jgi:hypothetical protein
MTPVIYNVTVNVSDSRVDEWLSWMRQEHIPAMLGTGLFVSATLVKVIGVEQGGKTFAVQYRSDSMRDYERYHEEHAPKLQARSAELFGEDAHSFRTVLEIINSFATTQQIPLH